MSRKVIDLKQATVEAFLEAIKRIHGIIPESTHSIVLLGRHSMSVQEGDRMTRALTEKGLELCQQARPFYDHLLSAMSQRFGALTAFSSNFVSSILTTWEITEPSQIIQDPRMNTLPGARLKRDWVRERRESGISTAEMMSEFFATSSMLTGVFQDYAMNYLSWICDTVAGSRFKSGFFHAIGCSLAAKPFLPAEELFLDECQAHLFCLNDQQEIIHVIKIEPVCS